MKKCKYCQSDIDQKAKVCSHCGRKQGLKFGKWIILGVLFLTIIACVSGGDGEKSSSTNEKTTFYVGEVFSNSYIHITFDSANENFTNYSEYATVKDNYKIVSADFSFENVGSSDELATSYDFNCYADGVAYEQFYFVENSTFSHTLSSGKKAYGTVYCEVPKDANSITLEYDTSVWNSENIEFIIK